MAAPIILLVAFLGWTPVGPERGSITAIHAGQTTLAGTSEGRLFAMGEDHDWRLVGELDGPVTSIAEGPRDSWVLAGSSLYRAGTRVNTGVHAFAVSPSNDLITYVATSSAIHFTSDGGVTWSSRPGGARSIDVDARDAALVWAVRPNGVVEKSNDSGLTWTRVPIDEAIERIDAHPRRPSTAFAISAGGLGFRTVDGQRWTQLFYLTGALTFDPQHDDDFYAVDSAGRLFHTDDDGEWLDTIHGGPILSLTFAADGALLAGFREDGVMRSEDGGHTWTPERRGLLAADIHSLAASPHGAVAYAGSVASMFRTTNRGATWDPVFTLRLLPGPFSAIAIDARDPNRVWIGAGVSMWFSSDGGVRFNRLFWAPDREPQSVVDAAFDPIDPRAVLVLMSQSLFRLETAPLRLIELTPEDAEDDRWAVLATDGTSLWVGGSRGTQMLLLHSSDGGQNWTNRSPALPGSITSLHVYGGRLIAGTSSGHIIDNDAITDLRSGPINAIASDGTTILAAANGVFASTDGATWRNLSGGLTAVTTLTSGSLRLAGTAGAGVFVQTPGNARRRAVGGKKN